MTLTSTDTDRDAICQWLAETGATMKAQQALVRSCQVLEQAPASREQLEALLRLLTTLRRGQRVLLRVWRSLPLDAPVPDELVAQTAQLHAEHGDTERLLALCRAAALRDAGNQRELGWELMRQVTHRHHRGREEMPSP